MGWGPGGWGGGLTYFWCRGDTGDVWQLRDGRLVAAPPHALHLRQEVVQVPLAAPVHKQLAPALKRHIGLINLSLL